MTPQHPQLTVRDRIQIGMFKSVFRVNADLCPEERFARAVTASCDELYEKAEAEKPELIHEYIYSARML